VAVGIVLANLGVLMAADPSTAPAAPLLEDKFDGSKLNETVWEKGGTNNPVQTVRDGSLRLISNGMANQSIVTTKQADFNFFKQPVIVVWDLVPDRTLAGPYAATDYSKADCGLQIGAASMKAGVRGGAELGLTAWPGKVASQGFDAPWYYTLNLGHLVPNTDPVKTYAAPGWLDDWKLSGVPQRIIWMVGPTDWSVEIKGAKFLKGNPQKRTGKHELKEADFAQSGFHLLMCTTAGARSMESGANFQGASVYTDQITVVTSPEAIPPFTEAPHKEALTIEATLRDLVGKDYSEAAKPSKPQYLFGINYAGGAFRKEQGFVPPTEESLDYWKSKGVMLMRLPFNWKYLQPKLNEPLDEKYIAALKKSVSLMGDRGMQVLLDMHDYAKYDGKLIGTEDVSLEAYGDVWKRLAEVFKDNPAIWGYGLMNEPDRKANWPAAAQAAVTAIRTVDMKTQILVASDNFAKQWTNPEKQLIDPANNVRWEAHMYLDGNSSGKYNTTYDYEINKQNSAVGPMVGVKRLEPFVKWIKEHNLKGFIGEFSVPANLDRDPRWLIALDNVYEYLLKNELPNTFWAAGTLWTPGRSYVIEPNWRKVPEQGKDRPQTHILLKYARKYAGTPE
jgi:endoglucanase